MVWLTIALFSALVLRLTLRTLAWAVYNNVQNTAALSLVVDFSKWFLGGFLMVSVAYAGFRLAENLPWFKGTNGKTDTEAK